MADLNAVPEHDPDAERRFVGGLLCLATVCRLMPRHVTAPEEVLYLPEWRRLYKGIQDLLGRGVETFDEVILHQECPEISTDDIGRAILDANPALLADYEHILREKHKARKRVQMASDMLSGAPLPGIRTQMDSLEETRPSDALDTLGRNLDEIAAGTRFAQEFIGWKVLSDTQCLLPGTLTLLCGSPGKGKSFFFLEAIWRWCMQGVRAGILALEGNPEDHLWRVLAQMSGCSDVLRTRWVRKNRAAADNIFEKYRLKLQQAEPHIYTPPPQQKADCKWILGWLQARCGEGYRVLVIDPITMMQGQERRYLDHEAFVYEAKTIIARSGASLICVSHPKDGKPGEDPPPSLNSLPGSKAWQRFTDTILWLECHAPDEALFKDAMGPIRRRYNRTLIPLKVRHEEDPGKIRYYLDGSTLCHREVGVIVEDE